MSSLEILAGITLILLLGTLAQWLGWRLGVPSILLLLAFGITAGPGTGWIDPGKLFGDALIFPMVSAAVAIILFEGGLSLHLKEFRQSGQVILRLISVGALTCLLLTAVFARLFLGFDWDIALLFGAILVITGPTVIGPLLRQIRPRGRMAHIVKWEGILNDPVGAVLAVLIFESILSSGLSGATGAVVAGILRTLGVGILVSVLGAVFLVVAFRRRWVPDYLHVPVTLTIVIGAYTLSDMAQKESGLLTVTLLGVILANQRSFPVKHIIEFKENLQVLLISALFIVLGARVDPDTLLQVGWGSVGFLVALILVVRPASVLVSVAGSDIPWKERVFLMLMAPRGIVVTALASLFAFRLSQEANPLAERMFAETLFVVLGTVLFYGVAAGQFSRWAKLGNPNPRGVLMVGAHPWARAMALRLRELGVPVSLIDTNPRSVEMARAAGLDAHQGSVDSYEFLEEIDFSDMGRGLALTPNSEINALAELSLGKFLGKTHVYHLATSEAVNRARGASAERQQNVLFAEDASFDRIERAFYSGARVEILTLAEGENLEALRERHAYFLPLFCLMEGGLLRVFSSRSNFEAKPGSRVVALTREEAKETAPTS